MAKCKVSPTKLKHIEDALDALELRLYDEDICYSHDRDLLEAADELFDDTLDLFHLAYSDPGEPQAEGFVWQDKKGNLTPYPLAGHGTRPGARFCVPLTSAWASNNGGLLTSDEEEAGAISLGLYWARLHARHVHDILESEQLWEYWEEERNEKYAR